MMKIQVPLVRSPGNLKWLRPNLEKVGYSSKCSFGDGDIEKEERKRGKMEILFNTNGSWHTLSNVRTPTLHCETKNLNTEWFIHKHREKRENKVQKWRRQDSQKVETLCNFDDSKQTTYQTGHMEESENHFLCLESALSQKIYCSFTHHLPSPEIGHK